MKSLLLILAATLTLSAQASETCMLEARTWTPRSTSFKFFPSDADSEFFFSATCQKDSDARSVKSFNKEDLGGSAMMGLINMYSSQGFRIVSCGKQSHKATNTVGIVTGRGIVETCYAVK